MKKISAATNAWKIARLKEDFITPYVTKLQNHIKPKSLIDAAMLYEVDSVCHSLVTRVENGVSEKLDHDD